MGRGWARWESEPVFIAEASPVPRVDVFLAIYELRTPGPVRAPAPPGSGIIVWPGPGRAICSARRAAPLPPRAGLGAVPSAHPPGPLCMRQHGRLLAAEGTEESQPGALPGSQPRTGGRESQQGHQSRSLVNKKPTPGPHPSRLIPASLFFLPDSTSSWYALPFQHPSAVIPPPG